MMYLPEKLQAARNYQVPGGLCNLEELVRENLEINLGTPADQINMDHKIIEDMGANSLDVIEIIMYLERELDCTIEETVDDGIIKPGLTVGDLIVIVADILKEYEDYEVK